MADVARGSLKRGQQVERLHVGVEAGHLLGRQVEVVDAELAGLAQDVVVDVGDVAHALRLVAEVAQPPLQHVVGDVGGGVAEVGASYGVMPHVYMVTTGPGSNGTTSRRAVSYSRIGSRRSDGSMPGRARSAARVL